MTWASTLIVAAEAVPAPDLVTRSAIRYLVARSSRHLARSGAVSDAKFLQSVSDRPIAVATAAANQQHYELPAAFYELILGPARKYSCCLFADGPTEGATDGPTDGPSEGVAGLADAEQRALAETAEHADLRDGQRILELGCGWGSLSLWMARRLPNARITAVSNSQSQRAYIEGVARRKGLTNLSAITSDMNTFDIDQRFDRIVSVEMFEHMSNWRLLLGKVQRWLEPNGRLFIHVFTHRSTAYVFDSGDAADWIAQHFFTGGIMPSRTLIEEFSDLFRVEEQWRWNGKHYEATARQWLANYDAHDAEIRSILRHVYGAEATLWHRRWRLFFLATMGLFGHGDGEEWAVSHYRLAPVHGAIATVS